MRLREVAAPTMAADLFDGGAESAAALDQMLAELVGARLVQHDLRTGTFTYSASGDDRHVIDAIAVLYSQWPETLARLFYDEPPEPLRSFSRAFRLRIEKDT